METEKVQRDGVGKRSRPSGGFCLKGGPRSIRSDLRLRQNAGRHGGHEAQTDQDDKGGTEEGLPAITMGFGEEVLRTARDG